MSEDTRRCGENGKFRQGIAGIFGRRPAAPAATCGCGHSNVRAAEDLPSVDWCAAWRFVTAVSASRVYGVRWDGDPRPDGTTAEDVAAVLLEFAGRILDTLGPANAAEVLQRWGVIITCAEAVASGPRR